MVIVADMAELGHFNMRLTFGASTATFTLAEFFIPQRLPFGWSRSQLTLEVTGTMAS